MAGQPKTKLHVAMYQEKVDFLVIGSTILFTCTHTQRGKTIALKIKWLLEFHIYFFKMFMVA